mgnify:CR=1 FL=1
MKHSFISLAFALSLLAAPGLAEESIKACLQLPSRTSPCPSTIYRGVVDPNTKEKIIFCFCKTDIVNLFDDNVSDAQRALNKMEWRELVAQSGYTEEQLIRLVSR